jgi:transposase
LPTDNEFTKILGWPGYRVYQHAIDEQAKRLQLWVRRKRGNRAIECSGCGRKFREIYDASERAVRDLQWGEFQTTVFIEVYRVKCPDCGVTSPMESIWRVGREPEMEVASDGLTRERS